MIELGDILEKNYYFSRDYNSRNLNYLPCFYKG